MQRDNIKKGFPINSFRRFSDRYVSRASAPDLVLKKIQKCAAEGGAVLDFTGYRLQTLPKAINQCLALRHLFLGTNWLDDSSSFKELLWLQSLELTDNRNFKIEGIEQFQELRHLDLTNIPFKDMKGITTLNKLKTLKLSFTKIKEITLESYPDLEVLHLEGCPKLKFLDVSQNTKLKTLYLPHSPIQKIQGLENLKGLEVLNISATEVKDVEQIAALSNLKDLDISFTTQIKTVRPLASLLMNSIEVFTANSTNLEDMSETELSGGLPALRQHFQMEYWMQEANKRQSKGMDNDKLTLDNLDLPADRDAQ